MTNLPDHKHYRASYRAYYNTSFSPDKRAISECKFFDETIEELRKTGADEKALIKFESLFLASLSAKSNCASSMITGSGNFPVARMEKMNNRERARTQEMYDFIDKVKKAIHKQNNPLNEIRSDDKDAITKLKQKVLKLEKLQEQMKACNKIVRDKKDNKIERLAKILGTKEAAQEVLKPSCFGTIGFESFELTNNNAAIKSAKARIAQLQKVSELETKETTIGGVRVVQNTELMRIQFFFEGKPEQEIIKLMKKNGFKWSPTNICWQRLLNSNAIYSVKNRIEPELNRLNNN